jgi:hypothetical protein
MAMKMIAQPLARQAVDRSPEVATQKARLDRTDEPDGRFRCDGAHDADLKRRLRELQEVLLSVLGLPHLGVELLDVRQDHPAELGGLAPARSRRKSRPPNSFSSCWSAGWLMWRASAAGVKFSSFTAARKQRRWCISMARVPLDDRGASSRAPFGISPAAQPGPLSTCADCRPAGSRLGG